MGDIHRQRYEAVKGQILGDPVPGNGLKNGMCQIQVAQPSHFSLCNTTLFLLLIGRLRLHLLCLVCVSSSGRCIDVAIPLQKSERFKCERLKISVTALLPVLLKRPCQKPVGKVKRLFHGLI